MLRLMNCIYMLVWREEVIIIKRVARRRGIKPWGRGIFDKDNPMIICHHQGNDNTTFDVPIDDKIISLAYKRIKYGSNIYTDEFKAYDRFLRSFMLVYNYIRVRLLRSSIIFFSSHQSMFYAIYNTV